MNGMNEYGLGSFLNYVFSNPIFLEKPPPGPKPTTSWLDMMAHPFASAFAAFGMREKGQNDSDGTPCLNLDQLSRHNAVEHDVSLTRRDFAQGDNNSPQPDLIEGLLAASTNGKTITLDDFIALRRRRYEQQKQDNAELDFTGMQVQIACTEVALILKVFGDGKEVPVEYIRAWFKEGRLPRKEGWSKRTWWTLGLFELNSLASKVQKILGPPGEGAMPVVSVAH
ncbi:MAG: hypothetical protein Q9174_005984 [Haloplaca sp. 1 TL-2023]